MPGVLQQEEGVGVGDRRGGSKRVERARRGEGKTGDSTACDDRGVCSVRRGGTTEAAGDGCDQGDSKGDAREAGKGGRAEEGEREE